MTQSDDRARNKGESASPNTKGNAPQHQGGDASRKTQQWGRGNTKEDWQNENSSEELT